ncbi:MAG: hypothetical protein VR65_13075 [Desulfobulbaceae bacterium BRH_c16a]|nr:MAG: hypothetical protein VR65_13075 [Desulfobulbaceae bacterium BRH_c16a]
MEMPKVTACEVSQCAYNANKACHAMAITIGDISNRPKCDTFFQTSIHGGVKETTAGVGACKISECNYNEELECSAANIKVGMKSGTAECLTFTKR